MVRPILHEPQLTIFFDNCPSYYKHGIPYVQNIGVINTQRITLTFNISRCC